MMAKFDEKRHIVKARISEEWKKDFKDLFIKE